MTFEVTAPGICAFAAQYTDAAPAAIEYLGSTYVQSARLPMPNAAPGRVIGGSGDWAVYQAAGGRDLELVTRDAMFEYRPSNC